MDVICLDENYSIIDFVDEYQSLIWHEQFFGAGAVKFYCNKKIDGLKYLYISNSKELAVIEQIEIKKEKVIYSGRLMICLLDNRVITGTETITGTTEEIARNLVLKYAGQGIEIESVSGRSYYGNTQTVQVTGENLMEYINGLLEADNLGGFIYFDYITGKKTFIIKNVNDETSTLPPLSKNFENILSYEYSSNKSKYRNYAIVVGQNSANKNVTEIVDLSNGEEQRQIYVDASDVKQVYTDDAGVTITLTDAQFSASLKNKGVEKLSDYQKELRISIEPVEYNTDLKIGSKRIFKDDTFGIYSEQVITEIVTSYENNSVRRDITFGKIHLTTYEEIMKEVRK